MCGDEGADRCRFNKVGTCAEIARADRKKERKNKRAQQQQVMQDEEERVK